MNVVNRALIFARKLAEVRELGQAIRDEIAALGGVNNIDSYFLDENGDERTDLELSKSEFSGILTTGNMVLTAITASHQTNIYRAIN
jgi:hypothetical protein